MEQEKKEIDESKIRCFCDNFAYEFVTSHSVEKEFSTLTGDDMLKLYEHMSGSLSVHLRTFLKKYLYDENY